MVASRVSRTLSRLKREGGISLQTLQPKRASSRVEGKIAWFLSSCGRKLRVLLNYDGDFRDPLVLLQESPVSMRVARGFSGFLSSWCRVLGPHLELRLQPQVSSPVLTCISGFLWSFNWRVRTLVETCKSTFLLSCNSSVRLTVKLT